MGKGRNPFDPSGRQMECFRCGSRDHLADHCSLPKGKGKGGGGKKGRFFEDGYWNPGAVDGADYSGFTESVTRSFMTLTDKEVDCPHGFPICTEYESDWTPSVDKVVSHHQPVGSWRSRSITYTTPQLLRECRDHPFRAAGGSFRTVDLTDLHADEDSSDDEDRNAAQRRVDIETARLDDRRKVVSHHQPVVSRPPGFPKPRPKPKPRRNEDWKSVLPADRSSTGWFPTEIETAYLASVRLPHGTSLLVDTGSPGNIVSDGWSEDHALELRRAGAPSPYYAERDKPMVCSGIGHGTQEANWDVTHPIALGAGRLDEYTAPELPNAKTPALLGQRSMKKLRTLIDTFTGKMYLVGPGGYEIRLSPGSEMHKLEESPAGHLMLPCSRFDGQQARASTEAQTFLVGDFFEKQLLDHEPPKGMAPAVNSRRRERDLRAAEHDVS